MKEINPEFIERYQLLYEQNPKSKIFAPLAEGYRKMGLLSEGLEIARTGVSLHPDFSGGRVALARLLLDQGSEQEAVIHLQKAVELSPENILAQSLLADLLLKLKNPKEALKAYKMVLFLQPKNKQVARVVSKLESLTADEYEEDVFSMQPLKEAVRQWEQAHELLSPLEEDASASSSFQPSQLKSLERLISLADAFLVRNDMEKAQESLEEAQRLFGLLPEIQNRFRKLNEFRSTDQNQKQELNETTQEPSLKKWNREEQSKENKVQILKNLLQYIGEVRKQRIDN